MQRRLPVLPLRSPARRAGERSGKTPQLSLSRLITQRSAKASPLFSQCYISIRSWRYLDPSSA